MEIAVIMGAAIAIIGGLTIATWILLSPSWRSDQWIEIGRARRRVEIVAVRRTRHVPRRQSGRGGHRAPTTVTTIRVDLRVLDSGEILTDVPLDRNDLAREAGAVETGRRFETTIVEEKRTRDGCERRRLDEID